MKNLDITNKSLINKAITILDLFPVEAGADKIWFRYTSPMLDCVVKEDTEGLITVLRGLLDEFNDLLESTTVKITQGLEKKIREVIDTIHDEIESVNL